MSKWAIYVLALLVFVVGFVAFEAIESKIPDTRWFVVVLKIVIALLLVFIYGFLLHWVVQCIGK